MNIKEVIYQLQGMKLNNYQITTVDDNGSDLVINCPYHKGGHERTGSFSILVEDKITARGTIPAGTGHCFACGATKMLPQLVSDITGQGTYEQSREWLEREFNYSEDERVVPIQFLLKKEEDPTPGESVEYKHFLVENHEFFERRHITQESIRFFELGIDNQFGYAVFPIKDKDGNTRMLFKRSLEGKRFHNTAGAKKDDILFALDKIYNNLMYYRNVNQIWVVESVIDAILLWQRGYLAVAMLQAIPTKHQLELLNNLPFPEIIIGTDNDEAGLNGKKVMIENLDKQLYTVIYPNENIKDIGDFKEEEEILIEKVQRPKSRNYQRLPLG